MAVPWEWALLVVVQCRQHYEILGFRFDFTLDRGMQEKKGCTGVSSAVV